MLRLEIVRAVLTDRDIVIACKLIRYTRTKPNDQDMGHASRVMRHGAPSIRYFLLDTHLEHVH
jgi:hypothetical protein